MEIDTVEIMAAATEASLLKKIEQEDLKCKRLARQKQLLKVKKHQLQQQIKETDECKKQLHDNEVARGLLQKNKYGNMIRHQQGMNKIYEGVLEAKRQQYMNIVDKKYTAEDIRRENKRIVQVKLDKEKQMQEQIQTLEDDRDIWKERHENMRIRRNKLMARFVDKHLNLKK